jgi:hypothetical protein
MNFISILFLLRISSHVVSAFPTKMAATNCQHAIKSHQPLGIFITAASSQQQQELDDNENDDFDGDGDDADDGQERERMLLESLGLDPRNNDELLEYSIDSFLRGDYDRPFADDAVAPLPNLSPGDTVEAALRSLRNVDDPEPAHGAAVLLRFCVPLSRAERWGGSSTSGKDLWKELLRGALTPTMLANRLRASDNAFSGLLDWHRLDVTDGTVTGTKDLIGLQTTAYVNAALYYDEDDNKINNNVEPDLIEFKLKRFVGGVWLIDSARKVQKKLLRPSSLSQYESGGAKDDDIEPKQKPNTKRKKKDQ